MSMKNIFLQSYIIWFSHFVTVSLCISYVNHRIRILHKYYLYKYQDYVNSILYIHVLLSIGIHRSSVDYAGAPLHDRLQALYPPVNNKFESNTATEKVIVDTYRNNAFCT